MSQPVTPPALTPEEWETVRSLETSCAELDAVTFLEIVLGPDPEPHAAAAALLYDRSFGFTREMVTALRTLVHRAEASLGDSEADIEMRRAVRLARETEVRLTALLPDEPLGG